MNKINYLTSKDVMQRYQIKKSKLYELLNMPDFPSFKLGKIFLVREDELLEWEESLKN